MAMVTRRRVLQTAAVAASGVAVPLVRDAVAAVGPAPAGSMTLAWHTNIARRWHHDGLCLSLGRNQTEGMTATKPAE